MSTKKLTIDDAQKLAKLKNGKCISKIYINAKSIMIWECHLGHKFESRLYNVKSGYWCPTCSKLIYKSENICRLYFEAIFNTKFPSVKPDWLINPNTGYKLELDGYCKALGIAFEYQGQQHYKDSRVAKLLYSKTTDSVILRDKIKANICKNLNINLFIIKYDIPYEKIPEEIKKQCIEFDIDVSNLNFNIQVDFNSIYSSKNFNSLMEIINDNKGKLLSGVYLNKQSTFEIKCNLGHIFKLQYNTLKKGYFCPTCNKNEKGLNTLKKLSKFIENKKGILLASEYISYKDKTLNIQCFYGHTFQASVASLKSGRFCRVCQYKPKRLLYNSS